MVPRDPARARTKARPARSLARALILLSLVSGAFLAAPAPALGPGGDVRVSTTGDYSEMVETIPIGRHPSSKKRVVMSLHPGQMGELRDGDRLDATAEIEVTVCLKPDPDNIGPGHTCIGREYGYDPRVRAQLVLAPDDATTGSARTTAVSKPKTLKCKQSQPNRNHHCVLTIASGHLDVNDTRNLACNPGNCYLNMVLSAYHPSAKSTDRLVIGSDDSSGDVHQDRGRINAVRYRPGTVDPGTPEVIRARRVKHVPIEGDGENVDSRVVYSAKISNLREGDQLVVDGKVVAGIGSVNYNVFTTSQIILADHSSAVTRILRRVTGALNQVSEENGFNCTQGSSAFESPCTMRKVGVVTIGKNINNPIYVNMSVGMAAQLLVGQHHHSTDAAKVLKRGYLKVTRYPAG